MKNITKESIIGQVVADNNQTVSVFKKYAIDFCCNGNRSIQEACLKTDISVEKLLDELNVVTPTTGLTSEYASWPIDLLVDYILKKHHRYVEEKITEILPYLEKIVRVHGKQHPELYKVQQLFSDAAGELTKHLKKEELILFPFIQKMVFALENNQPIPSPHFQTVENPIQMMHHEHNNEGERFRQISNLTNTYTPPKDACTTFRLTYSLLQEFENDLHQHIHLENNILFPKAQQMETALRQKDLL